MATSDRSVTRLALNVDAEQLSRLEQFQAREKVSSRVEALRLLLDIALDTVSQKGRRFWDSDPNDAAAPRGEGPARANGGS